MKVAQRLLAVVLAGGSLVTLAGCSVDEMLWGAEGANVIETTEQLIAAATSRAQDSLACPDSAANFGDAGLWNGLDAGEPEPFDPTTSRDRPGLDATRRINLEGAGIGVDSGREVPTDVFYRTTETGLCVADIIWQEVVVR